MLEGHRDVNKRITSDESIGAVLTRAMEGQHGDKVQSAGMRWWQK